MGKLNQDFRYHKSFDFIALLVFVLFLSLFAKSLMEIVGAFATETYTNTMSQMASAIKMP